MGNIACVRAILSLVKHFQALAGVKVFHVMQTAKNRVTPGCHPTE
jgi:hypothetical protein